MRLKSLELSEFKQHRKLSVNLDAPVIGITGDNHAGKTNLLRAIRWMITGKLDGKQESHVYGYCQQGPKTATGTLTFEKGGKTGVITRTLGASSKRTLEWDGKAYTKSADVDEKMSEIFGSDLNSVDRVMFTRQGELASALFGTPADRERLFTTILDVGYLAKSAEALEEKILYYESLCDSGAKDLATSLESSIAEIDASLRHMIPQLTALKVALGDQLPYLWSLKMLVSEKDALQRKERENLLSFCQLQEQLNTLKPLPELSAHLARLQEKKSRLQSDLNLGTTIATLKSARDGLVQRIESIQNDVAKLATLLATEEDISAQESRLAELTARLTLAGGVFSVKSNLENLSKHNRTIESLAPNLEKNRLLLYKLDHGRKAYETELADLRELVSRGAYKHSFLKMRLEGSCACPMCDTEKDRITQDEYDQALRSLEDVKSRKFSLEARLEKDISDANRLRSMIVADEAVYNAADNGAKEILNALSSFSAPDEAENILNEYQALAPIVAAARERTAGIREDYRKKSEDLAALQHTLENCPPVKDVPNLTSAEDLIAQTQALDLEIEQIQKAITEHGNTTAKIMAMREASEQDKKAYAKLLQTILEMGKHLSDTFVAEVLNKGVDFLQDHISAMTEKSNSAATLSGAINMLKRQKEEMGEKLARAQARILENEQLLVFIDNLKRLRSVFRKGALPSAYIEHKFGELCEVSKEFLGRTDATFEVERDPELPVGFVFRELEGPDGLWQPQDSLSGGQRVRLSVAFLIAIQQVLISDLGLLILDEPTQHLDAKGVESLQELLSGIQNIVSDAGSQIIVCDHDEALIPSYNIHIHLS